MTVTLWNGLAYILKLIGPIVKVLRLVDNEKKLNMGYIYIYIYGAMDHAKEAIQLLMEMKARIRLFL